MECSICLEDIEEKDLAILYCKHKFHKKCILNNINYSPDCPYCRSNVNSIKFIDSKKNSITSVFDLEQDYNITFSGFYFYDTPLSIKKLKLPLFFEDKIIKCYINLNIFKDLKKYILEVHFDIIISWVVEVINYKKIEFNNNDYKFIFLLVYKTLKNFKQKNSNYQLLAISTIYHYIKLNNIILNKYYNDNKLKDDLLHISMDMYRVEDLNKMIKLQKNFL